MYIVKKKKDKWIIIKKGAKRATKAFKDKISAIYYADEHYKGNYEVDDAAYKVMKTAKKKPGLFIALAIIVLIAVGVGVALIFTGVIKVPGLTPTDKPKTEEVNNNDNTESSNSGNHDQNSNNNDNTDPSNSENHNQNNNDGEEFVENIIYDDFQIHFMTLGNDAAGDSIYIKAGDNDILIDAGSQAGSFNTTSNYIKSTNLCSDNKFEYVIATHGDADHISAFPNYFSKYAVDTVIDFSCETYEQFKNFKDSKASSRNYFAGTTKDTATYGNYLKARDTYAKKHYTAGECFNNLNGAQRQYQLSDKVTMNILYNYYYFDNDNNGKADSTDENNFSVCTLFTYKDNDNVKNFILTGDLEIEGEEKMSEYYNGSTPEKTLPEVELYKAGHHGSKTSSNDCLLKIIKPKICVVSCCCGTDEYTGATPNQFPTQQFIDRIAKYTDRVYVTSIYDTYTIQTATANSKGKTNKTGVAIGGEYIHTTGFKPMNGNVCISCNGTSVGIFASNNLIKLKDSDWFKSKVTIDGKEINIRNCPNEWK